jgi:hypothetical protein
MLVEPEDPQALTGALERAAGLPSPNAAARAAAAEHDVRRQARLMAAILERAVASPSATMAPDEDLSQG